MTGKYIFAFFVLLVLSVTVTKAALYVQFEWKYIDYVWESVEQKEAMMASGDYNASLNVPYDVDKAPDGRYFITTVRDTGVPVALSTISCKQGNGGPLLAPYPDWSWHARGDCMGFTSVYRIAINCNRIWVIDNGKIGENQVCPPLILVFDLLSNKLLKRVEIPSSIASNSNGIGLLVNILVNNPTCNIDEAEVYISDVEGYGMVTYHNGVLKRIESHTFEGKAQFSNYTVSGESFYLQDGILAMALKRGRNSILVWRCLSDNNVYSAATADIRRANGILSDSVISAVNNIPYRSASMVMSYDGCLYLSQLEYNAICVWNTWRDYKSNARVIEKNDELLQFATGMKIIDENGWNTLKVMTNRLQVFNNNKQNINETNFRVITVPLYDCM